MDRYRGPPNYVFILCTLCSVADYCNNELMKCNEQTLSYKEYLSVSDPMWLTSGHRIYKCLHFSSCCPIFTRPSLSG
jgi:hypothetical protein